MHKTENINYKKLRIIALHGYQQSGPIFQKKTSKLAKILTSLGVDYIHYPTAPHITPESQNSDGMYSC